MEDPLLGGGGLHVNCDAHFRTWPRFSRQKSCVKIWLGLVEAFKSYRGYKKKKKRNNNNNNNKKSQTDFHSVRILEKKITDGAQFNPFASVGRTGTLNSFMLKSTDQRTDTSNEKSMSKVSLYISRNMILSSFFYGSRQTFQSLRAR